MRAHLLSVYLLTFLTRSYYKIAGLLRYHTVSTCLKWGDPRDYFVY